jgi:formiminotetrahydrofolate cyclodeaminase
MDSLEKLSCGEFIEALASKSPTPGGGGAAALVGAIGTALGNMVGSLTAGKPKYADVEDEIVALKRQADKLQQRLLHLVKRDDEVFRPLAKAYGMPSAKEDERRHKASVMEGCLRRCCAVPLEIMEVCAEAIELHGRFAEKGTAIAISDVGCGVVCCKAAMQAASLNVFINTKSMADRSFAGKVNAQANALLAASLPKADAIFSDVAGRF